MSCAQINVVGGGSAEPATVSFPGAYTRKMTVFDQEFIYSPPVLQLPARVLSRTSTKTPLTRLQVHPDHCHAS